MKNLFWFVRGGVVALMLVMYACSTTHVNPTPSPVNRSLTAINSQHRGIVFANGWSKATDADSFVAGYAAANIDCLHFEVMEYVISGDLATIQKQQCDKLKPFAVACKKYGIWFVVVNNSNDYLNNAAGVTTATLTDRIDYELACFGNDGVLIEPWSETASSRVDGNTVRNYAAAKFPGHCLQYVGTIGGAFVEAHPCSTSAGLCGLPGKASSWIVTDCTPMMTGAISDANLAAYIKGITAAGASASIYGVLPTPAQATACYGAFGGAVVSNVTPAAQGAMAVKSASPNSFVYNFACPADWPDAKHEVMQCRFQLHIRCYNADGTPAKPASGDEYDWLPASYAGRDVARDIDSTGRAYWGSESGRTMEVWATSNDGRISPKSRCPIK